MSTPTGTEPPRLLSQRGMSGTVLAGASLVQLAANAAVAVISTALLGAEQRGVLVLGVTIGSVCAVIGGLGTGAALRARLPTCDPVHRRRLVNAYTWWTAAGSVLALTLTVGAAVASAPLVDHALADGPFLVAVGVFAVMQVLLLQTGEAWFADGYFRRAGLVAAGITVGGLIGLLLAAAVAADAPTLLLGQSLAAIVTWSFQVGALRRAGLLTFDRLRGADVAGLAVKGAPALGLTLGLAVALRADRYILGMVSGPAAVGVYSLAATLSEIPRIGPQTVGQFFVRDVALGGGRLSRPVLVSVVATGACALVVGCAGMLLIEPVFGSAFAQAAVLLPVLLVAEICFAPYAVASRGLLGGGWNRAAGTLGAVAAAVATGCYLAGAGAGSATGLAVSCVLVYGGLSVTSLLLFRSCRADGRCPGG